MEKAAIDSIVKYNAADGEACKTAIPGDIQAKVTANSDENLGVSLTLLKEGEETAIFRVGIPHKSEAKDKKPYWE